MKERNSVAFDFLMYSSKVDSGQIDVFEIDEDEITGEHSVSYELAKTARDYSILYSLHHEKGVLDLKNPDNSKILEASGVILSLLSPAKRKTRHKCNC